jgi:hypothetical protein
VSRKVVDLLLHVARARDITTSAAHVVERLALVSGFPSHVTVVTHHARRGRSLLRLEVHGLVLAAFHALLLDARQLDAKVQLASWLKKKRASQSTKRKCAHEDSSSMSSSLSRSS